MEGFQNFNTQNFDPNALAHQTTSVIMFIGVLDISPSIRSFESDMNTALRDVFMQELKNSHRKDDIVIKAITFNENVTHKSGFMPITSLQDDYLEVKGSGGGTALYQAVLEALVHANKYREDLEDQGIDVRTNITIITDGVDNQSPNSAPLAIRQIIDNLRSNEAWSSSYTITLIGVGKAADFTDAAKEMGLDPTKSLVTIGTSAAEIRKQMGVVSQSVSSSNTSNTAVTF
jgi:uncharacterized protein YegL